jgi:hypothetical protein
MQGPFAARQRTRKMALSPYIIERPWNVTQYAMEWKVEKENKNQHYKLMTRRLINISQKNFVGRVIKIANTFQ